MLVERGFWFWTVQNSLKRYKSVYMIVSKCYQPMCLQMVNQLTPKYVFYLLSMRRHVLCLVNIFVPHIKEKKNTVTLWIRILCSMISLNDLQRIRIPSPVTTTNDRTKSPDCLNHVLDFDPSLKGRIFFCFIF